MASVFSYSAFDNTVNNNPGAGWVRRTYGAGGDQSADRTQMIADRLAVSDDFLPDISVALRRGDDGLYVPHDDIAGSPYVGSVYRGKLPSPVGTARWRPQSRLVKADGDVGGGVPTFSVLAATLNTARTNIDLYVSRAFISDFGANKDRALLTLRLDENLRYFKWIGDPTWLLTASSVVERYGTGSPGCVLTHRNTVSWTSEDNATTPAPAPWWTISIDVSEQSTPTAFSPLVSGLAVSAGSYLHDLVGVGIQGSSGATVNNYTYRVWLVDGDGIRVMWKDAAKLTWNSGTCTV